MKKLIIMAGVLGINVLSFAAEVKITEATVTEIHNDVKLKVGEGEKKASEGDQVNGDRALLTGKKSRAELEFNDKSIARLGANTIFSFKPQSRDFKFEKGTLLFQVPKGHGTTQIATPAATCAVIGTTVQLMQVEGKSIYMVMEGVMEVTVGGQTYTVKEGQALVLDSKDGKAEPPLLTGVDISTVLASSDLINAFKRKLPSYDAIMEVRKSQAGYEVTPLDEASELAAGSDSKNTGQEILSRPDAGLPRRDPEVTPPTTTIITGC